MLITHLRKNVNSKDNNDNDKIAALMLRNEVDHIRIETLSNENRQLSGMVFFTHFLL